MYYYWMMARRWHIRIGASLLLALTGCVEAFEPEVLAVPPSYLVVDGFINSQGRTRIKLSRTVALTAYETAPSEKKAQVYIEEEAGTRYALREVAAGYYISDSVALSASRRYRLRIQTEARHEYASAYSMVMTTPAIDSINWSVRPEGVQFYVSTHDDRNQTRRYRWEYAETWEYYTPYVSQFELKLPNSIIPRSTLVNHCWRTVGSTAINIFDTNRLTNDVVAQYPLQLIPDISSYKLRHKYSILVRQYAQTAAEQTYWEMLQKNTENIGTLFDPLPSQLKGNIRNLTDTAEVVLGYIGAYSVTEKRLFLNRSELPADLATRTGYEDCRELGEAESRSLVAILLSGYSLIYASDGKNYVSTNECVDCRLRGGKTEKPAFW
jgi:hypothetical protein